LVTQQRWSRELVHAVRWRNHFKSSHRARLLRDCGVLLSNSSIIPRAISRSPTASLRMRALTARRSAIASAV
jgi:hypothetical protein